MTHDAPTAPHEHAAPRSRLAALPLVVGFVFGVAFICSCGGGGGNQAQALPGQVRVHEWPISEGSAAGDIPVLVGGAFIFTTVFTPESPAERVLGVAVRGTYDQNPATGTGVTLTIAVSDGGADLANGQGSGIAGAGASVAAGAVSASGPFAPATAYRITMTIEVTGDTATFDPDELVIQVLTATDVELVSPSPQIAEFS